MTSVQVSELVIGLKSRNAETRRKSIRELYHFAKTELREMPQETLTQVLDEFNQQIHALITSYDTNERRAGILTIVCLIGGDTETTKTRTIRYANYLKNVFPSSDISILELAAKTMGRLATTLGVKRGEYVESEIKRAFEWLAEDRNEAKRLSAVLILKEMAIAMPSYFYLQINGFFNHIMAALRDPKEQVREVAAKALRAALVVTAQRENSSESHKAHWYIQCYEEAATSFTDMSLREKGLTRDDHVHGALLILNELMRCSNADWEKKYISLMQRLEFDKDIGDEISSIYYSKGHKWSSQYPNDGNQNASTYESTICHQLLNEKYETICSDVMTQQISRSQHVHQMLLLMIPRLAAFNKDVFVKNHLKSTINHLITFLRGKEKEKAMAFTTLGLIAVVVESDIQPYLNRIIDIIKLSFSHRDTYKKRQYPFSPLYNCITLLSFAMKEDISTDLKELLEPMCAPGLSLNLTTCLKELSQNSPSLKKDITDRLLNMLSIILRKKPHAPSGSSTNVEQQIVNMSLFEPHDANKLVLALRTLGTFDFEWQNILMSFIRRCIDHYLQSEQQEVRLEAVRTAAKILSKAEEKALQSNSNTLHGMIDDAISKLLSVGRTDFDKEVRYWVFEIFTEQIFDRYLAHEEHLNVFFVAINDESLEVREIATCIVGRLSNINPSYVAPTVRQLYIHHLIDLQHSGLSLNKEQAVRMVNNLILHAPTLTRPYMDTILNVLVPKLKEEQNSCSVVASILKAIGDLADINGDGTVLSKWLSELLPILYNLLSDPNSSEKRSVALWCFSQLISATGYVIKPYTEYPNLLDILLGFLKSEQLTRDRRETIRLLGLLGALDPYKHRVNRGQIDFQTTSILIPATREDSEDNDDKEGELDTNVSEMLVNMSPLVLDDFYPAVVVTSLMKILRDPTLAQHHTSVVHSITFIFKSLGIKCVPYISRVIPSLLYVIRTTDNNKFREFLFTQLAQLIAIVKVHIRPHLGKVFDIIKEFWAPSSQLLPTLVMLVEQIAVALGVEFSVYLPRILPYILRVLHHDTSKDKFVTEKILLAIQKFENNLDDVLQVVVPEVTKLFDGKDVPVHVSKLALETIGHLSLYLDFKPFSSRIIHPLVRVLDTNPSLRQTAMSTLCSLIIQLGRNYNDFIPAVEKIIQKHKLQCTDYVVLITRLQMTSTLASDDNFLDEHRQKLRCKTQDVVASATDSTKKLSVDANKLSRCWAVEGQLSKEDWLEWLRRLSVGLLCESHSPAIRACSTLAQNHPALASELFNASFMSCWTELDEPARRALAASLERALSVPDAPQLAHAVLQLAEFVDHCERGALPLSIRLLGDRAISCRAYAKALYYKEQEYRQNPTSQVVEALIHINNKLQQKEAANGLLERVMTQRRAGDASLDVHVRWYEKLLNWGQALELYERRLDSEPQDNDARLGQMRCLEALGDWERLHDVAASTWPLSGAAPLGAAAAWQLQRWDAMRRYVDAIPPLTQDGAFMRAALAVRRADWPSARDRIDDARSLLDAELAVAAGDHYRRAYPALFNAQLLAELEEVVSYELVEEKRPVLRRAWHERLLCGQRDVDDWRKVLRVRGLVLSPREDADAWLKFASLCRKSGELVQAERAVALVAGCGAEEMEAAAAVATSPRVALAACKVLWARGRCDDALAAMTRFVGSAPVAPEQGQLLARCHLRLASWARELRPDAALPDALRDARAATVHAPHWAKAWHAWASLNFEAVLQHKRREEAGADDSTATVAAAQYATAAVEGFFRSMELSEAEGACGAEGALQDTLRLLWLWFEWGGAPGVGAALAEGARRAACGPWLLAAPQLLARLERARAGGGGGGAAATGAARALLARLARAHPEALVLALTAAARGGGARGAHAAGVLRSMAASHGALVEQAQLVSEELVRVAILWHEQWFIALDEASRFYFSEKDIKGMLKTLEPMHAMLEEGPETLKELSFIQMYGRDLREAQDWCNRYKETGVESYLNQAWDLYYGVFRRISAQIHAPWSLELQYVSERLLRCRDLQLPVPGSYLPHQPIVRIAYIHTNLQVIKSKQRPRRLTIRGSDGKDYMFLLKGHEDLRQDERVMQLFGLVNTLLKSDPNTYRHDLGIQRYAVVPLSTNSGLIGWVPQCDTMYNLIGNYREKKGNKLNLNTEQNLMNKMTTDLPKLTLMQKVEVFEHALSQTPGDDLARLLWLKSPSAEAWFERRNNYTRSVAVMSMVGYILGLGDRHPSNIMLHRVTGKILHIDFGDCFEVTLTREKFPEKIPFRLTRMMINAMEVTGIEGTYRSTCEAVMQVLHKHKESVMAVLEAFVYDPLLNWRLVETGRHSMSESSLCSSDPETPTTLPSRSRHHYMTRSAEAPLEPNLNKRALATINRIRDKLTGKDFPSVQETVTVQKQVDLLIQQATNNENLCQCFKGWCPFW